MEYFFKASLVSKIIFNTRITKLLGKGTCNLSIITSAVLALTSFFYVYTVGSYFKVSIYVLQNRVTYNIFFSDIYVVNKYVDNIIIVSGIVLWIVLSIRGKARFILIAVLGGLIVISLLAKISILLDIIALMSVPIIILFLIYNKFAYKKVLHINTNLSINYLALVGFATVIVSITMSLARFFSISISSIPIRNYSYDIFLLVSSFSPVLMFLLILCFPVKLLMKEFMIGILKFKNNRSSLLLSKDCIKSKTKFIYLLLFVSLSIIIAIIPNQPPINKDNQQIGVDTGFYVNWVNILLHSNNLQEFIQQAFVIQSAGDRPLVLIFLFTIVKILNANLVYIIQHSPIVLGPALVLVVYFLTRELTSNDTTSLLASFLTAISFHTLIGIYAGFYANWFALIIGYLSFVFLIRYFKKPTKPNLIIFSTLIAILMFSHLYTWTILIIVAGIFLAVMFKLNYYRRKSIILLLLIISSSVLIDIIRTITVGSSSGIQRDISVASRAGAGLAQFALRWSNLIDSIQIQLGGLFNNFIILILGLYWLFHCNLRELSTIFLVIFLSIGVIPLFFGDWIIQTRIFYNIPFQIPAAIALTYIKKQANGTIILLPICIWLASLAIIAVSNFYLILS